MEKINVKDPNNQNTSYEAEIIKTTFLGDGVNLYLVHLWTDTSLQFPVIVFADGFQFTPIDWEYYYDEIPENIEEEKWVAETGHYAIIMDGLPRII